MTPSGETRWPRTPAGRTRPHRSHAGPPFRRLDRLTVDNGRARLPIATCALANISSKLVMDPFPGAVEAPTPEVVVDGLPARYVVRQQPPSASGADQVQDCVQDRQAIMFRGAPSQFGRRHQSLDSFPLFVAQIAGIAGPLHAFAIAHPGQTSTFQIRSQARAPKRPAQ